MRPKQAVAVLLLLSFVTGQGKDAKHDETKKPIKKNWKWLWDQNELRSYNIMINSTDLAILDDDPAAEEYVPCSVQTLMELFIDNLHLETSGVRLVDVRRTL